MLIIVSNLLKKFAETSIWQDKIQEKFGITCAPKEDGDHLDPILLRQTYIILDLMPEKLVRACKVPKFYFSSQMGPNLAHFPSHGYFYPGDKSITLNNNIFYHPDIPDDFFDERGYYLSRPDQTLYHELGHAFDDALGDISKKSEWMSLSGWSFVPKPGLKRLVIKEPGQPSVIGEMFFDPKAEFTRFYGKRNCYDDFADSFSMYIGLRDKVPALKRAYFDKLLKKYYQ